MESFLGAIHIVLERERASALYQTHSTLEGPKVE
jgi:hypothetical protein